MISFIVKGWIRQKERFLLMMIGALLISGGLSTLIGLSESNKGTVVDSLQKKWDASYHIVVRPEGTKGIAQNDNFFDPNYISGVSGGISLDEYNKIKEIPDIDIAAPISMIGFTSYNVILKHLDISEPGIYRLTSIAQDLGGLDSIERKSEFYFSKGIYEQPDPTLSRKYGIIAFENYLSSYTRVLLAGVDPIEEARLVGLENAVLPLEGQEYFSDSDMVYSTDFSFEGIDGNEINVKNTGFPILLSNRSFLDQNLNFKLERLVIPFNNESMEKSLAIIEKNGGEEYLKSLSSKDTKEYAYNSDKVHTSLIENLTGVDSKTGEEINKDDSFTLNLSDKILQEKTGPLTYQSIGSPFPERWEKALQVIPYEDVSNELKGDNYTYRKPQLTDVSMATNPRLSPYIIGLYDPSKLNISKDPLSELPMETYSTPTATHVLNKDGQPVNPPKKINSDSNIYGFLMQPPTMLTTIEAAGHILGDKPISAIRIKVKGVETIDEESQKKLELVAKEIKKQTGLHTDITLGSSPQPLLINIPKVGKSEEVGWVEQLWVKKGASITIFKETKLGYSGIIISVILVAIMYVFSTNLVSYLSRKQEFAVLLSIGWKPRQLKSILIIESLLIGIIVSLLTLVVQLGLSYKETETLSISEILLLTFFILLIYIIGPLFPSRLINKIHPWHVMRAGETNLPGKRIIRTKGLFSMVFNTVMGRVQRNLVSILAIALPTALLILFIYVTFRLNGVLYTSWLGQYVFMEVGIHHYIAVSISLLISILTTSQIMWQNIKERRSEISLLKALGWKNAHIRKMVLVEGAVIGLIGGLVGGVLSFIIIYFMYGPIPLTELWLPLISCLIPIIVGILGSWIPSRIAVKMQPIEGAEGRLTNSKRTDKQFKVVVSFAGATLFVGVLMLFVIAKPDFEKEVSEIVTTNTDLKTEGDIPAVQDTSIEIAILPGASGAYLIDMKLDKNNLFHISAEIDVTNESQDTWSDIGFYFIPNAFTEEYKPEILQDTADVSITSVTVAGEDIQYDLSNNKLLLKLDNELLPGAKNRVKIDYTMKIPEHGNRLSRVGANFYLAQWYPMLGHYQNGWNIKDYEIRGESYHTSYGDYKVNYSLPKEFLVVSSVEDGEIRPTMTGKLEGENIKDFYMALLNPQEWTSESLKVNDTTLRLLLPFDRREVLMEELEAAGEAFAYLEKKIGDYPYAELDLIGNGGDMEYPNVVEFSNSEDNYEVTLVHEIAHQWFYNMVSNDPYHDAWLDESLAVFVTSMFLTDKYKDETIGFEFASNLAKITSTSRKVNLALDKFKESDYHSTIYGKTPLLLRDFFRERGGQEEAIQFLSDYFNEYQFKYVDSNTFSRFFIEYFGEENREFLDGWLD
ncbi:FtsX-like permease family protein [Sporosarcina sp. BP05]|uniref:FtsX-like permease family protein n=1 Tax=Sporosarcina sp. BP05 TaxID=2758726 RepID=UPI00164813E0|nr:FtsX-like permease family protein [Sporosarcina sp. BP05]